MEIRELGYDDLEEASEVLWKSFYEAEKKNTSMEGMELFRDLVSPVSLSVNSYDGSMVLYGGFFHGKMVVVGALKDQKRVLMLYVRPEFRGSGYGKRMLRYLEEQCTSREILLNSSDPALKFYEKNGYRAAAPRKIEKELIFTPMKKEKEAE